MIPFFSKPTHAIYLTFSGNTTAVSSYLQFNRLRTQETRAQQWRKNTCFRLDKVKPMTELRLRSSCVAISIQLSKNMYQNAYFCYAKKFLKEACVLLGISNLCGVTTSVETGVTTNLSLIYYKAAQFITYLRNIWSGSFTCDLIGWIRACFNLSTFSTKMKNNENICKTKTAAKAEWRLKQLLEPSSNLYQQVFSKHFATL